MQAVWDSHDLAVPPMPNAHTPHSWLGLAVASLYGCQLLAGLLAFYLPLTPLAVRQASLPLHRLGGVIIFVFALAATLMGVAEKWAFMSECSGGLL